MCSPGARKIDSPALSRTSAWGFAPAARQFVLGLAAAGVEICRQPIP
jgi:hypothetical protein